MGLFLLHLRKRPSSEQRRASQRPSPVTAVLGAQVDAAGREMLHVYPGREEGGASHLRLIKQCRPALPPPYWAYCLITDGWHIDRQQRVDVVWKCENPGTYGSPIVALNGCFWAAVKQVSLTLGDIYWHCTSMTNLHFNICSFCPKRNIFPWFFLLLFFCFVFNNCYSCYSH